MNTTDKEILTKDMINELRSDSAFKVKEVLAPLLQSVQLHSQRLSEAIICESALPAYAATLIPTGLHRSEQNAEARASIARHITHLEYDEDINSEQFDPSKTGWVCAAVAASPETIELAHQLNTAKAIFARAHQCVRDSQTTEAQATDWIREILKLCGYGNLSLPRTDAAIPTLTDSLQRIRWYLNTTAPSQRRTVSQLIDAINERVASLDDPWASGALTEELTQLSKLPSDTPVAYRIKQPITSLKYRARAMDLDNKVYTTTGMANNPLLYDGTRGFSPICVPLEISPDPDTSEIDSTEADSTKPKRGRPRNISDERASMFVGGWYWYHNPPGTAKSATRETSHPTNTKQQDITGKPDTDLRKTAVRGIWFAELTRNGTTRPYLMVGSKELSTTSISLNRHGLEKAWLIAVDKLINAGTLPKDKREEYISLQPERAPI